MNPYSGVSLDDLIGLNTDDELELDALAHELDVTIENLLDRNWKRSSTETRETNLIKFARILTARFSHKEIEGKEVDLMNSFVKSIKAENSVKETIYALKALSVLTITTGPSDFYEPVSSALRRTISDSASVNVKAQAIHTLGTVAFCSEISEDEVLEILNFLLEIISSDGNYIEAHDEPAPVIAALEEWGLLATLADDLSGETEDCMEAFVDQLGSGYTALAVAAGQSIALLYEKSYTPPEENENLSSSDDEDRVTHAGQKNQVAYVKRFEVYRQFSELEATLSDLASLSGHSVSKKDKRSIHTNFSDILNSIRNPTHGPGYRGTIDEEGREYGSSMTVKIGQGGVMLINKWWKLLRLKGLTRVLQGGFPTHYEENHLVFGVLPVLTSQKAHSNGAKGVIASPGKEGKKGRKSKHK